MNTIESDATGNSEEQVSTPFNTPLAVIKNDNEQPKKRRKNFREAVSHIMGKESEAVDVVSAVVRSAKLNATVLTVSSNDKADDVHFISSPIEIARLQQYKNKSVKVNVSTCDNSDVSINTHAKLDQRPDDYMHSTLYHSNQYSFLLQLDKYSEISKSERYILNRDWSHADQVRLACAQLLAGAILVQDDEILLINMVEVYARSAPLDAHHERIGPIKTFSSIPTRLDFYQDIVVKQVYEDNSKKLIIGTFSFNALITSSLRLDINCLPQVGPSTHNFSPSKNTRIYIAHSSIELANSIIEDRKEELYPYDLFHQLRQLRTKLTSPSTYTISRACSLWTNDIRCRPYTVFTLADSGTSSFDNDEILGSMVLRCVAKTIMNKEDHLRKTDLENILRIKTAETTITQTTANIVKLMGEQQTMPVLYNAALDSNLKELAVIITHKLPEYNKAVIENIKNKMAQLKNESSLKNPA